jgi:hypothetical protein
VSATSPKLPFTQRAVYQYSALAGNTLNIVGAENGGLPFVNFYLTPSGSNDTLTLTPRGSGGNTLAAKSVPVQLQPGNGLSLHTDDWVSAADSAASSALYAWYSNFPVYAGGGTTVGIGSGSTVKLVAGTSLVGQVETTDAVGNLTHTAFASGATCTTTGVATALVAATSGDAINLSDGTNNLVLVTAAQNSGGQWFAVTFGVIAGNAYTFSGTGFKILGGGYVVT